MSPRPRDIDLVFEESFEHLYARAYRMAYQLLGRRSDAEDVAQETLGAGVRALAKDPFVRRRVGRTRRGQSRDRLVATPPTAPHVKPPRRLTPGPDAARVDLHRALRPLSRRQREVLVLRFLADLPEADVATALGCSVGSVKVHASRGLAALRVSVGAAQEVA